MVNKWFYNKCIIFAKKKMLIILSPSKTMDFSQEYKGFQPSTPIFMKEATTLVSMLQQMKADEIKTLMQVSGPLASQTKNRFMEWTPLHNTEKASPALFAFSGDVYDGLNASSLNKEDIEFAQKHLMIFSGLYGMLRAMDLMMPYRLELGAKWETEHFKNLYSFWKDKVNIAFAEALKTSGSKLVINLASAEYSKIIDFKTLGATVVSPGFYELNNGKLKMISIYAKRARGLMTRHIIQNKIINASEIISFQEERYGFLSEMSKDNSPVFAR